MLFRSDGLNSGRVGVINFTEFNNLKGSNGYSDSFNFEGVGFLTGLLDGGTGIGDNISFTSATGDKTVQLGLMTAAQAELDGNLNIHNIETVTGNTSTTNTLIADNRNNNWSIDGDNTGTVAATTPNTGTTIRFEDFENITGNSLEDTFTFTADGHLDGQLQGGSGVGDTVHIQNLGNIAVVLGNGTAPTGGDQFESLPVPNVDGVEIINASANAAHDQRVIIGANQNNFWRVTGENTGTVAGFEGAPADQTVQFNSFNHVRGGTGDDNFRLGVTGDITGSIDGGESAGDNDTVDYSLITVARNIALISGTDPDGIKNLEGVIGNSDNERMTLTGYNADSQWIINGENQGIINQGESDQITFQDFHTIIGGNQQDTFNIEGAGSVTGSISGGAGDVDDILNVSFSEIGRASCRERV